MKIRAALLICTALSMPMKAEAGPFAALFYGLQVGFAGVGIGAGIATSTAFSIGVSVGTFFGGTLGSLLLNIGTSYALAALNKPKAPGIDDARVNTRLDNAPRWIAGGSVAVGGAAGPFMEFDDIGTFWFIVAHVDGELVGDPTYILDGITVELSDGTDGFAAGEVLTDEFCLDEDGNQFEGDATRVPYWRIFTVTPDAGNLYGALPTEFTDAFPNLPADFLGAGVCFSIIRGAAIGPRIRNNMYRWRGVIGIGEPNITLVGNFSRMYDPRNEAHDIDDPDTWTASDGNPAIVWAWHRTFIRGRNKPMASVNWTKVAEWADIFDTTVLDRNGNPVPLYRCGVTFPDDRTRSECEAEILNTCDGFVAYDDEGKSYIVGGYYQAPTLTFTDARDVLTMQSQTVNDGETALDGVICEYISPAHGYTKQPSAPWQNPLYYDGTREPNYQTISVLGCQDHNQAVRIAKAHGQRIGAARRAALGTTIKGILAKGERAITLDYDAQFDGVYEVATNVEEDASGMLCRFAVVPLAPDRWTLNDGEEGAPPQQTPALNIDTSLEVVAGLVVSAVPVVGSEGSAVRLEATFDAPARLDRFFRFRYTLTTGAPVYEYFIVDMDEDFAYSAVVQDGAEYEVSWQTATAGGRATVWSDERDVPESVTITATANTTPPLDLVAFDAADGVGESEITFATANDLNQRKVEIYQGTTTVFGDAVKIDTTIAGANASLSVTVTGLAPDTYYFWAVPLNGSNVAGTASGPETAIVS